MPKRNNPEFYPYAAFPETYDNDQIQVLFQFEEEKEVFLELIKRLLHFADEENKRDQGSEKMWKFFFKTTLEATLAQNYEEEIERVVGIVTFRVLKSEKFAQIGFRPKHQG